MPLIIISGYPCSGKTFRSEQLIHKLQQKISESHSPRVQRLKIHHIDDTRLGLSRHVYAAARSEKDARATLSSAIKRVLDRDTIVVADGMNYIKGFRYQLYCEAKAVQTTHCVLHIATPADQCREWNELALKASSSSSSSSSSSAAEEKKGYTPSLFENLIFRYEEPNGMSRWDSPLFTIPFEDASGPYEAIWEALIGSSSSSSSSSSPAKIVRQNAATVLKPAAEQGYLYALDKTTSEVIAGITAWLRDHAGEGGGEVKVAAAAAAAAAAAEEDEDEDEEGEEEQEGVLVVHLPMTAPSLPQLQRLRRQFITLNRQHSLTKARIRHLFVDYLNDSFQS